MSADEAFFDYVVIRQANLFDGALVVHTLVCIRSKRRWQHDLREEEYTRQMEEPPSMPQQEQWSQEQREALQQALTGLAPSPMLCKLFWCDASAQARWKPAWQSVHLNGRSFSSTLFSFLQIKLLCRRETSATVTHGSNMCFRPKCA